MFIAIEGIDGSGKTTLASNLALLFQAETGVSPVLTREPYDPEKRIRKALASVQYPANRLAIMFAADRVRHLEEVVEPALADHATVICDRYILSTMAYQSAYLDEGYVRQLVQDMPLPDITVVLDIDPEVSVSRLIARGMPLERYERSLDTQKRIRANYLRLATSGEFGAALIVADNLVASLTPEKLAAHVFKGVSAAVSINTADKAIEIERGRAHA